MVFLGAGALLKSAVTYAIANGYKVDCVYTLSAEFKRYWEKQNIHYFITSNYNNEYENIVKQCTDGIVFSINNIIILKAPLITNPTITCFNIHSGLLPNFRGRPEVCIVFALLANAKEYGVTLHIIDKGIDTGPVLNEKVFEIDSNDTFESVMTKALTDCQKIFEENIMSIVAGSYSFIKINRMQSKLYCLKDINLIKKYAYLPDYKRATELGNYKLWYSNIYAASQAK